jgi:hypothetical protein
MPEKTIETPTRTMPEKPTERIEETTRRYMREAETTARDTMRTFNDLLATTTNYYFDTWDKSLRYGMELTRYMQDAWENVMTTYRRMYTDNYKTWENYSNEISKLMIRPR